MNVMIWKTLTEKIFSISKKKIQTQEISSQCSITPQTNPIAHVSTSLSLQPRPSSYKLSHQRERCWDVEPVISEAVSTTSVLHLQWGLAPLNPMGWKSHCWLLRADETQIQNHMLQQWRPVFLPEVQLFLDLRSYFSDMNFLPGPLIFVILSSLEGSSPFSQSGAMSLNQFWYVELQFSVDKHLDNNWQLLPQDYPTLGLARLWGPLAPY